MKQLGGIPILVSIYRAMHTALKTLPFVFSLFNFFTCKSYLSSEELFVNFVKQAVMLEGKTPDQKTLSQLHGKNKG